MPSLTEAFKTMCNRGVIAECLSRGDLTAREVVLKAAEQWYYNRKKIKGFAHLGEWDTPTTSESIRVPVRFGKLAGNQLDYRDPGCLEIGKIVVSCLKGQGVPFEWDEQPGSSIVVTADGLVTGLPSDGHDTARLAAPVEDTASRVIPPALAGGEGYNPAENIRFASLPDVENYTFDRVGENPVRLLNVARMREQGLGHKQWHRPVKQPRIGDYVKLKFYVPDAPAPQPIPNARTEGMWVEVKHIQRSEAQLVYRGELLNEPVFIDPDKLCLGSMVCFTADHVFPPM